MRNDELIVKLKEWASKKAWFDDDDFNPHDYSGGNFDDAYYGGTHDGQILLARDILEMMGI
jgi:hypothetical protein